eukprot:m.9776 g.9776  ORF g.9776 m.9776 type:complete len:59 (+) comp3015_c0_seq2:1750-1926(+)
MTTLPLQTAFVSLVILVVVFETFLCLGSGPCFDLPVATTVLAFAFALFVTMFADFLLH